MSTYENSQKAIDAGGDALRPANRFPWYDKTSDGFRRLEVAAPEKASSFEAGALMNSLIFWVAIATLALVLTALILMLLRAVRLRKLREAGHGETEAVGEARRIEALPVRVTRTQLSLLDQARTFYQAGNYASAMIYLFSHQLVQLDRHQVIRLAKGKTNRQYLREVGQADRLRALVGQAVVAFEDVFFGHHEIDRQRFETCWSHLPEFEKLLAQGPPAAA